MSRGGGGGRCIKKDLPEEVTSSEPARRRAGGAKVKRAGKNVDMEDAEADRPARLPTSA